MSKVAIIILNYNGRNYLEKFLPGVLAYSDNHSIYVADNKSTDDSVKFLSESFPKVKLIQFDRNHGFAGGYNEALKEIDAEYYILLNSDVEVSQNWIGPLLELLEENADIAACQPKILDYNLKEYFEYAGAAGGFIDSLGYPFCRGRMFTSLEKDFGQYDDVSEIFWASGACMMIRAELFHKAGGFDADYFAHMEEIDLCWRLKHMGNKIYFSSKSTVYHVGGGTLPESNSYKTYLNFRNSFITLIKNIPARQLYYKVPIRLFLDIVAAVKFLVRDSKKDFLAVFRADFYIINHLFTILSKRKSKNYSRGKLTGIFNGSIVISFYFLHRRYFFNL